MTRSQSAATSGMTWLETRTARPSSASRGCRCAPSRALITSRPLVGSSNTRLARFDAPSRAPAPGAVVRPSTTRRRGGRPVPRDRVAPAASVVFGRDRGRRHALKFGAVLDVFANGQVVVDADRLGHDAEPGARLDRPRATSMPSTSTRPLSGRHQPGDRADRRRLAGAVRTEQSRHDAVRHLERHAVDRGGLAVTLANLAGRESWTGPRDVDHERRPRQLLERTAASSVVAVALRDESRRSARARSR